MKNVPMIYSISHLFDRRSEEFRLDTDKIAYVTGTTNDTLQFHVTDIELHITSLPDGTIPIDVIQMEYQQYFSIDSLISLCDTHPELISLSANTHTPIETTRDLLKALKVLMKSKYEDGGRKLENLVNEQAE